LHKTSLACRAYGREHPFCETCGTYGIHVHHIKTRGAGGTDKPENLIALCPECHHEVHRRGWGTFAAAWGLEIRFQAAIGRASWK